jgi:hypothetical protein
MCKSTCESDSFFTVQAQSIQKCIEEHKWFLSEKAGHDVGWVEAEENFLDTYFMGFAAGFRASYCGSVCSLRHECEMAKKYLN